MNQHKPSQAHRIAALLDDFQPHCSNEMREMFIADAPRRINDLEEEGYIIKKEYCTMHSYHDGLPKMYTLVSKPDSQTRQANSAQVEQRAAQPESPRRIENTASQPGPIDSCDKPKPVRWQDSPEFNRPSQTCCDPAKLCSVKGWPIQHSQKCLENKAAIK